MADQNQQPPGPAPGPQKPSEQPQQPKSELERFPAPSQEYIREAESLGLAFMNPKRWQMMQTMSQTFIQSGSVPSTIKNAAQLMIVFQAGYEFGLQPVESMEAFYFVHGKLTMYGETVIAQVLKVGHKIEWGTCDATTATVTITRKDNGSSFTQTLTMEEATKRKMNMSWNKETRLWEKRDVWETQPDVMLRYRVFGKTARFIVADALHGARIKEEIESIEDAEIIDVETIPADQIKKDLEPQASHPSLSEVIEKGVEKKESAPAVPATTLPVSVAPTKGNTKVPPGKVGTVKKNGAQKK